MINIALAGPSGVGKSYLAKEMEDEFPKTVRAFDSVVSSVERSSPPNIDRREYQQSIIDTMIQQRLDVREYGSPVNIFARSFSCAGAYTLSTALVANVQKPWPRDMAKLCADLDETYHNYIITFPYIRGTRHKRYSTAVEFATQVARLGLLSLLIRSDVIKVPTYGAAARAVRNIIKVNANGRD